MSQADIEIQLKAWKDLAVSKQVLMGAATDALGLDAECTTSELKTALDQAIQRAKESDSIVLETRETADKEIAEMKAKMISSDKARAEFEEKLAIAEKARDASEHQMTAGKAENSEALKKARAEVADKQNQLKAISKALADTPENVVKKLKNLKKQKFDESKLRTQAETKLKATLKEKSGLESELEEQKTKLENASTVADQLMALVALCKEQNNKIESLSDNKDDLFEMPEIDEELVKSFQKDDADK